VYPAVEYVPTVTRTIYGAREAVPPALHQVMPRVADATATRYTTSGDGTYIETDVASGVSSDPAASPIASLSPTGMEPDGSWRTGAFFYGVLFSGGTNRIGHLSTRVDRDDDVDCRRGDNDFDHDGIDDDHDDDVDGDGVPNAMDSDNDNDGIPDVLDDDKNDDGIEDKYQTHGQRASKRTDRGTMGPGESREYEMTYDAHTVSMLAIVEAAQLTAPLAIEILTDDGTVLLTTPPALGKAVATAAPALPGVYKIRVRNTGTATINYKTTLVSAQIPY
jgi:hypothetical protein